MAPARHRPGVSGDPAAAIAQDRPLCGVVWGLGTGRHLLRRLVPGKRLRVLALDVASDAPEAALDRLRNRPRLHRALRCGELEVVVGSPGHLAAAFAEAESVPVHVHEPALDAAAPEHRRLAHTLDRLRTERAAARRDAPLLAENLRRNLAAVVRATPLSSLRNAAARGAVVVVAAGPSLTRFLPWLERAAGHAVTVVVDTALPVLARADIPADVAVCVDPHPRTRAHFARVPPIGVLAFQPCATPAVVQRFERRIVAVPSGDRFWDRAAPAVGLPRVAVAGTVLLYALQVAAACGPRQILLVGADLSTPGGATHAAGCVGARPADDATVVTRRSDGRPVPTTRTLRGFQAAVETHIAATPIPHAVLDGGGAAVAGAAMVGPREATALLTAATSTGFDPRTALARLPPPPDPDGRLERLRALHAEFDSGRPRANDRS